MYSDLWFGFVLEGGQERKQRWRLTGRCWQVRHLQSTLLRGMKMNSVNGKAEWSGTSCRLLVLLRSAGSYCCITNHHET